jgi:argininosuccinate lyase
VLSGALASARFDAARMRAALREGFVDATELADYLADKGVPFREAHHVAGRLVRAALAQGRTLAELTLDELRAESPLFEPDVYRALDPETAVERRLLPGGPSRACVQAELRALRDRLAQRGLDAAEVARGFGAAG